MFTAIKNIGQRVGSNRANIFVKEILPWITGEGPILDIGCGVGHIGWQVSQATKRKVHFLDIRKYPFTHPEILVELYDGKNIPYSDKYFDTSLVIFTLHHTKSPIKILEEAIRVTSKNLIVFEDVLYSRKWLLAEIIKDLITNCLFTQITFEYRTEKQWEECFKNLNVKSLEKTHFESKWIVKMEHVGWLFQVT
jgi:ubiquinone/menaquinone biosynthesis C-methylase UbiE